MFTENKGPDKGSEGKEGSQNNDQKALSKQDTERLREDKQLAALIEKMKSNVAEVGDNTNSEATKVSNDLEKNNKGQQK